MSELKATPGPWVCSGGQVYYRYGFLMGPPVVPVDESRLPGESWLDMRRRTEEMREQAKAEKLANAHLIAAAPELYEALEQTNRELNAMIEHVNAMMKAQITPSDLQPPDYIDQQTVCENAMLLAKARGEGDSQ